jgi:hypothetical protein
MSAAALGAVGALLTAFAAAAAGKLRSARGFTEFAGALGQFGVPSAARRPVAALVVLAELVVIGTLLAPVGAPSARLGPAVVVVAGFSVALAAAGARQPDLACHCFGGGGRTRVGPHLIGNALLIVIGLAGITAGTAGAVAAGTRVLAIGLGVIVGGLVVCAVPVLEAIGPQSMRPLAADSERG